MDIKYTNRSGFEETTVKRPLNIKHVTSWSPEMESSGPMRFFDGDPKGVIDVSLVKDEKEPYISVNIYPNTPIKIDIGLMLLHKEKELVELVENSGQIVVSINAETMKIVTSEDFTKYTPQFEGSSSDYCMFIFQEEAPVKYPRIFAVQRANMTGIYSNLLRVQAASSHDIFTPVVATGFGVKLTYCLLNQQITRGNFDMPSLDFKSIKLPTNGQSSPTNYLNISRLLEIFDKSGADKLVQSSNGIVDEIPAKTGNYELEDAMVRQFVERETFNLTDVVNFGVAETIALTPERNPLVPIELDISGIAKRMCIFDKKLHILPTKDDFDLELIFGDDIDDIIVDDEDTFPKLSSLKN